VNTLMSCIHDAEKADEGVLLRVRKMRSGLGRTSKMLDEIKKDALKKQREIKKQYAKDHKNWQHKNNRFTSTKNK
jgi:hypothetical protein